MRRIKFYPVRVVSRFVLLLLLMNVFTALAQDPGPNITKPTTCIDHNPGTVGSVYSYTYTGTSAAAFWTVKGDIQLLDAGGNMVDTLHAPTASIRSTAGYGKGRLIVTYDQTACSSRQEYVDVYKEFSLFDEWPSGAPENKHKNGIVGPACLTPNTLYTYTINPVLSVNADQEIGMDRYHWTVPPGWTVAHASSDSSYLSLMTPAVLGPEAFLSVSVGACNPVPYRLRLVGPVPVPVISPISWVPTSSTDTTVVTLSVQNPSPEYAYDWELPANWTFAGGHDGSDETQVNIVVDNTANSVRVVARKRTPAGDPDRDAATSPYFRIRRSLPPGSFISGATCVDGSKFNTYAVSGGAAATEYQWTFAPNPGGTGYGFSVANPAGTTVSFRAGTTGGMLSVVSIGCDNPVTLKIAASPARPLTLGGPSCVNANSTGHVYTVDPVPGATSYSWTLAGGLTSSSTLINGGTSINVNAGGTGGNVSVVANNGTCASRSSKP